MAYEPKVSKQAKQQESMLSTAPATLGVFPRFYAQQSSVLIMKPKTFAFSGKDFVTFKNLQGDPVINVRAEPFSLSHRVHVSDTEGQLLFTLRRVISDAAFYVYAEDPQGNRFFYFDGLRSFGSMKSNFNIINAADGRNIKLEVEMGIQDQTVDIRLADSDTVIASIERSGWSLTNFAITIAPNVDVALVVAMCICLHQRLSDARRRRGGRSIDASGANAMFAASAASASANAVSMSMMTGPSGC